MKSGPAILSNIVTVLLASASRNAIEKLRGSMPLLRIGAALLFLFVSAIDQAAAATCESLAALTLPDTTITVAQSIPAGTYTAPDGEVFTNVPAFCRVAAMLTPTRDSEIGIEVWLPT